jgi:hypothetical protein
LGRNTRKGVKWDGKGKAEVMEIKKSAPESGRGRGGLSGTDVVG